MPPLLLLLSPWVFSAEPIPEMLCPGLSKLPCQAHIHYLSRESGCSLLRQATSPPAEGESSCGLSAQATILCGILRREAAVVTYSTLASTCLCINLSHQRQPRFSEYKSLKHFLEDLRATSSQQLLGTLFPHRKEWRRVRHSSTSQRSFADNGGDIWQRKTVWRRRICSDGISG